MGGCIGVYFCVCVWLFYSYISNYDKILVNT